MLLHYTDTTTAVNNNIICITAEIPTETKVSLCWTLVKNNKKYTVRNHPLKKLKT